MMRVRRMDAEAIEVVLSRTNLASLLLQLDGEPRLGCTLTRELDDGRLFVCRVEDDAYHYQEHPRRRMHPLTEAQLWAQAVMDAAGRRLTRHRIRCGSCQDEIEALNDYDVARCSCLAISITGLNRPLRLTQPGGSYEDLSEWA